MSTGRLWASVRIGGVRPVRLPWPMTTRELVAYLALLLGIAAATIAVAFFAATRLIEPSPWRLAPFAIALVVLSFVFRSLRRSLEPDDVQERRQTFSAQERRRRGDL
ncbi:hypothetical protein [Plantibacter sp. lyk4-40-MEA-4]|uniref:hypothetical protein n=1 Tax=Plantibacter sp. lyk4-40-MEA-4 TaxID=3040298 RepID=UPI0025516F6D|nr:hypothetical protein [Plantibacter sp. lyk4-40-MEA-4]